jgi:hypothetical protein
MDKEGQKEEKMLRFPIVSYVDEKIVVQRPAILPTSFGLCLTLLFSHSSIALH